MAWLDVQSGGRKEDPKFQASLATQKNSVLKISKQPTRNSENVRRWKNMGSLQMGSRAVERHLLHGTGLVTAYTRPAGDGACQHSVIEEGWAHAGYPPQVAISS